jgi:hypothetical protein
MDGGAASPLSVDDEDIVPLSIFLQRAKDVRQVRLTFPRLEPINRISFKQTGLVLYIGC